MMTPRQRVVKYLVQITHNRTVEQQLRQQWLQELAQIRQKTPTRENANAILAKTTT